MSLPKQEIEYIKDRLTAFGYSSLQDYYASPRWVANKVRFRRAVTSKGCQRCGKLLPVDCHHLTYKTLCDESHKHLAWLCRGCHESAHDIWTADRLLMATAKVLRNKGALVAKTNKVKTEREVRQDERRNRQARLVHAEAKREAKSRRANEAWLAQNSA